MIVDLHLHENTFSSDSKMCLKDIVNNAKGKGIDAICITDHDSMGLREFAESYSKEIGFPIFVGVEYFSLQGDITAFGIDSFPSERISAQEFINFVRAQGGICFACHPFRNNNRGLGENLKTVKGLTGIEVLNGSTSMEANRKALEYCTELELMPIGASDAHWMEQIGKYATWIPDTVATLEDFVTTIKKGVCKPAILENGKYIVSSIF
ncbi:MAG: PHP domain-containing protein [Clostridium sp.]